MASYRHHELKRLFAPKSAAVIGVSQNAAAFSSNAVTNLIRQSPADAKAKAAKLITASKNKTLTEREAKEVLACCGMPVVGEKLVQSADEAMKAATSLGLPVAMKVESPDIPHKTEAGVIRLNLKTEADVKAAYDAVMANANKYNARAKINGVLVQPMVPSGTEIMVGARIDPLFGPLIVAGLGGILVELLKDTALDLAPITKHEDEARRRSTKTKHEDEARRRSTKTKHEAHAMLKKTEKPVHARRLPRRRAG